jgi:hypothetical protein
MNTAITGSRYKTIQTRRLPNACAPMNENGWQGCARPAVGPPIDGSGLARSVPGGPDHDQDDPGRGRDAQIGRPKNDRCLGRLSKAHAWAGLSDWLKNPACARHLAEVPTHSTCAPGRRDSTPHPALDNRESRCVPLAPFITDRPKMENQWQLKCAMNSRRLGSGRNARVMGHHGSLRGPTPRGPSAGSKSASGRHHGLSKLSLKARHGFDFCSVIL